ncbi:uncharacterized protein [Nicotiana tomentosiformis]|uniref:uncharacterized protein n=1 Tax=Nicotiana tomentosiformis TaxID=4098 RepID=UPI00051C0C76|nr:uncharacterized protein LOC104111604 [Nicotiana tomentosiformis]XP_009619644.1 uncharacterized protein LOC104111604 [Nicotiana tomentosiformis]XP_009619651.1 uncharacterized protein LOC104111604 [Nicotiana tomentosiformis]XP_009619658.1 uncharacterized protein LOC104111604 [Nicotiana tomentosiformis]XP_009619662.1 uncharacterized protein LOC104111604 [Nicotiana tomentosiformis]XP_009619668.1 uncharacterized protein LOC104111604 [Nicotiana tomentosiformis]
MAKPSQPPQNGKEEIKEIDTATASNDNESSKKKVTRKLPSPKELVSHYESQGMDSQEASFKVIDDLQGALFRMISTSRNDKNRNNRNMSSETSRKLDVINARLLSLDMKVDSKPGYPQALAIGLAAGGLLQVLPRVANSVVQIWNTVRSATNSSPKSC